MQCVWTFFLLFLLFTSAQRNKTGRKSPNSRQKNENKQGNSATVTENASAGVTRSTTRMETTTVTSGSISVSSDLNRTTGSDKNQTGSSDKAEESKDVLQLLLSAVKDPQVIIAFGIGVVLTALVWSLTTLCCRSKRKRSRNLSEALEMNGQPDEIASSPEVEYSDLDFSALKRQRPAEDVIRENTESEYAEIKKETTEEQATTDEREGGVEEVKEEVVEQDPPTCEPTEAESLWTEDTDK